jgi:hypothetical protein
MKIRRPQGREGSIPSARTTHSLAQWERTEPAPQFFRNKLALVTGSSRAMGAAIAIRLAAEGAFVIVNYAESPARAEAVENALVVSDRVTDEKPTNEIVRRLTPLCEQEVCRGRFLQGGSSLCRYILLASIWARRSFISYAKSMFKPFFGARAEWSETGTDTNHSVSLRKSDGSSP